MRLRIVSMGGPLSWRNLGTLDRGSRQMITVQVDASRALAKFSRAGIPESVRRNLRAVIPDLTKRLGAAVDANLDARLKTRRRLTVKKEMVENPTALYGRVTTVANPGPALLPLWLEEGTRPHEIAAKNASALFFFWEKMGKNVAFQRVMHPGFPGVHFSRDAFQSMESEIVESLSQAVRAGARAA
jgi:hypothetical protein